jgi:antitoxin (DNA-binding transcriptional repressor) of toxin-antitoxin stability system
MLDTSQEIAARLALKRNTVELIRALKKAGQPIIITISGKAELVVEDATSLRKLLELVGQLS